MQEEQKTVSIPMQAEAASKPAIDWGLSGGEIMVEAMATKPMVKRMVVYVQGFQKRKGAACK